MSQQKQIPVIITLRGIAALMVCLFHFVYTTTDYFDHELLLQVFSFGKKGVQVFFIISGIVIPYSMLKANYTHSLFNNFILKRFIRIEPPYLLAVALGIIYTIVRGYIPSSNNIDLVPTIKDTFLHLAYLIPFVEGAKWINPVFWTLAIEFQYYLFLAVLFPLITSDNNKISKWLFAAIIIVLPFTSNSSGFFLQWASFFGLGIFYILFLFKKYNLYEYLLLTIFCAVSVYLNLGWIDLLIGLITLSIIHLIPNYKSKIGTFLGNISYSLYLLHSIIGSAFINFMSHRFTEPYEKFFVILTGVLISIGSAYLFWMFVEKPSQKISQKIKMNSK